MGYHQPDEAERAQIRHALLERDVWDRLHPITQFFGPDGVMFEVEFGSDYNDEYFQEAITDFRVLDADGHPLEPRDDDHDNYYDALGNVPFSAAWKSFCDLQEHTSTILQFSIDRPPISILDRVRLKDL